MLWMPFEEFPLLMQVCKEWEEFGSMDQIWKVLVLDHLYELMG